MQQKAVFSLPSAQQWGMFYREWNRRFRWELEGELDAVPAAPAPPYAGWSLSCCLVLVYGWPDWRDSFGRAMQAATNEHVITRRGNYTNEPDFRLIPQAWQHVGWRWQVLDLTGRMTTTPDQFATYDAGGEEVLYLLGACPGLLAKVGEGLPDVWIPRYAHGVRYPLLKRSRDGYRSEECAPLILEFLGCSSAKAYVPRRIG